MVQAVSDLAAKHLAGQGTVTPSSAIHKRGSKVSNLWIFDSPKNSRRLTVSGDVPFLHLVLLEGDTTVVGYDLIDDPFNVTGESAAGYVRVRRRDGGENWLVIGRSAARRAGKRAESELPQVLREKAASACVQIYRLSELELLGKEVLLDNWLTLCAIITRAKSYASYLEQDKFLTTLARHDSVRVRDLLAIPEVDPAIMLAVVAKALQQGIIQTELNSRLFGLHSQMSRVRS